MVVAVGFYGVGKDIAALFIAEVLQIEDGTGENPGDDDADDAEDKGVGPAFIGDGEDEDEEGDAQEEIESIVDDIIDAITKEVFEKEKTG